MKKITAGLLTILGLLSACHQNTQVNTKDPLESGRGFIESSLKGDYDQAQKYLLQDSTNMQYLNNWRDFYNSSESDSDKEGYRTANILIDSTQQVSDSVSIITYSNTYKNVPSKIKLVRKGRDWLVDLKFTFRGNTQ
ncbi:MAG: hypothetical protein KGM98_10905 [Bacteroidota bacterium]|nr:hypothetical protein [Bacteroidota bacterium]